MTFTEAATEVLRIAGKPLHYKEITELAIEKNLLSHVGKSPEVTMGARLAALLKKEDKTNPIVRIKPGVFGLRDWDKKGRRKQEADRDADDDGGTDVNALEVEAATRAPAVDDDDEDATEVSGEDALRADLAASGAELFDDEDDDDQPILGGPASAPAGQAAQGGGGPASSDLTTDGARRRRRRRRRGRGRGDDGGGQDRTSGPRLDGVIQPTPIISVDGESGEGEKDPLAPAPRPMIRDRAQIMAGGAPTGIEVPLVPAGESEDLAGRELSDATVMVMSGFDRNQGPVPARSVTEALVRRGRLGGDIATAGSQLMASLRADNLRRTANGQRPRFRFAQGPRIGLTDWSFPPDLVRLESEAMVAVERFREASRRVTLRKLQELPGHVFVELALLALERAGLVNVKTVRRAGSPGGEAHFMGVHRTQADEVKTALVIRKDGREIGRERVTDLRGALHHYGPATGGWLVTTGQVLSGAREEAAAPNAQPIALYDGLAFCKLLEDEDVAVTKTRFITCIPDLELLDTLRGA